jgi:hypothetical protein
MQQLARFVPAALGLFALSLTPMTSLAAEKPAAASAPQEIGGGKNWTAYAYTEKGKKVCYMLAHPAKSEPAKLKRGRVDAMVTHRPAEKAFNVVNFDVGYPFKEGSSAELDVDGKKFTLFTNKDAAWDPDAATDKTVTEALAKGTEAVLKGTSAHGTVTTDTYSLDGFTAALGAIDKACNVKR